jgi:hypothetical protein
MRLELEIELASDPGPAECRRRFWGGDNPPGWLEGALALAKEDVSEEEEE